VLHAIGLDPYTAVKYREGKGTLIRPLRAGETVAQIEVLAELIRVLTGKDGVYTTEISGPYLSRFSVTNPPRHTVDRAVFCVVAQGTISIMLQREISHTTLASTSCSRSIFHSSHSSSTRHGRSRISGLLWNSTSARSARWFSPTAHPRGRRSAERSVFVETLDGELFDALIRLVRLLKTPSRIPILAPLIRREIFFRLLEGDQSGLLRKLTGKTSQVQRVAVAVEQLKREFAKPVRIRDLARRANMSPASLHAWFKAVTTMSPLQFQKRLRLLEARRLMYGEGADATTASYQVGYGSPSQFNRDYKRLFGAPPRKDIERLRSVSGGLNASPRERRPPSARAKSDASGLTSR
jgi:AraC-like DNA-binding protein